MKLEVDQDAFVGVLTDLTMLTEFAQWIVSLDDDDPDSPGRQERRRITLNKIIERARVALGE